jgi:UDP-N-acetylmuramoyl-tripeptide--D-alanyl-D-alanine ligase
LIKRKPEKENKFNGITDGNRLRIYILRRFFMENKLAIDKIYKQFVSGAAICTDTRKISDGCIFFALKGENFNGNTFAKQAIESGAALAVIDEKPNVQDKRFVVVKDVLTTLQELARHHRTTMNIPVIAITGSNGKTTTKELVSRVLSEKYNTLYTSGNLNNHIGVPLTLLNLSHKHECAVIEMGANHRHEIALLCSIALPTHVLITNVGKAHLEGFGGFEGVKKGKGEMFDFARHNKALVFLNDDNTDLREMLGDYANTFRYGTNSECDITGSSKIKNTYVQVQWQRKDNPLTYNITSNLTGIYNSENILAAIAVGVFFDVDEDAIRNAIETYFPGNQRSQEIKKGNTTIILDAYNANPTSMEAALKNFHENFKGQRAVFLGDMLELGETSSQEHAKIISLANDYGFDKLVFVGPAFVEAGDPEKNLFFENSTQAMNWALDENFDGYNILIKGSRGIKMEQVMDGI